MTIDLTSLYPLQAELDKDIATRHNITYQSTFHSRLLALIVELGEFANETRCFKYWSLKGSSPKDVVLEEYVDGLHFLLSLGIALKPKKMIYEINKNKDYNLVDAILKTYQEALKLNDNYSLSQYEIAFNEYLNLIAYLSFNSDEVINAYKAKLQVNYNRQINKY